MKPATLAAAAFALAATSLGCAETPPPPTAPATAAPGVTSTPSAPPSSLPAQATPGIPPQGSAAPAPSQATSSALPSVASASLAAAMAPAPGAVLVAVAGDIADCNYRQGADARLTASMLSGFTGTILIPGDLAYQNGTRDEFAGCYDKLWGPLKARTRPSPGNHEYGPYLRPPRNDAEPYFDYFGESAGPRGKGFYSFDLGAWHIVSLNSMAGVTGMSAPAMADQTAWLEEDLRRTDRGCILAFWHHPLFSSGYHGHQDSDPGRAVGPLWDTLARHGADLILNGHEHDYERFAPQSSHGVRDDIHGIREIVVGTGGAEMHPVLWLQPNSVVHFDDVATDHGVLFLRLYPGRYEWAFLRTDGTRQDASPEPETCHPKPARR